MSEYYFKFNYTEDRGENVAYKTQYSIASEFEPLNSLPDSYSGNCYFNMHFNTKTKRVSFKNEYWKDDFRISICEAIPTCVVLYQLLCLYTCKVFSSGPDGYKGVWEIPLKHKKTGQIVIFREWKGGFSLGCPDAKFNPETMTDVKHLLNLMINRKILHPYDGTVATTVA